MLRFSTAAASGWLVLSLPATAQTLGGVFGPTVDPTDRSAQYRSALDPEGDGSWAHRLHVQQSLNDSVRLRGVVQGSDDARGDLAFDHIQGELLWQVVERTPGGWSSALRFDVRLRDGGDPNRLGVNWTNQWDFANGWRVRGLALVSREVGDGADDGFGLGTRASLTRGVGNGVRAGVEMFNGYGNSDDLPDVEDQNHRLGPVVSGSLGGWGLQAGVLFGLTDGASDEDLRVWIGRRF